MSSRGRSIVLISPDAHSTAAVNHIFATILWANVRNARKNHPSSYVYFPSFWPQFSAVHDASDNNMCLLSEVSTDII